MSWYVSFYLGTMDKNGKIRPLGPYDCDGILHEIITTSRSFTTDLKDDFYNITDKEWTPELDVAPFIYEDEDGNHVRNEYLGYLPLSELPSDDYIRKGYFLISDIDAYEKDKYADVFYDWLTPDTYHRKAENELRFGKPTPVKDCAGEEIEVFSAGDYAYYMYPDYDSKEYESALLKRVAAILNPDYYYDKDTKIVVIKTEG